MSEEAPAQSGAGPARALLDENALVRKPEVAIRSLNPLPLLPAKQQKHFYTTPDATFNESEAASPFEHLLNAEHTHEFEYAGPNRLGTQAAYLNVPHRVQRGLVPLVLPNAKETGYGNEPFALPFPHLRKGDIAFYLRLENDWASEAVQKSLQNPRMFNARTPLALVCGNWGSAVEGMKRGKVAAADMARSLMMKEGSQVFANLQTVNYILHGIQHYGGDREPSWRDSFWRGFGLHRLDASVKGNAEKLCTHVVRCCMAPFGVVTSEVSHSSDQAVAMVVDGRVECMRNYWAAFVCDSAKDDLVSTQNERMDDGGGDGNAGVKRKRDLKQNRISSSALPDEVALPQPGDELILVLEEVSVADGDFDEEMADASLWSYVLPNRDCEAGAVRMTFPPSKEQQLLRGAATRKKVWQLVPSFLSLRNRACWERRGFWRLGTVC